MMAKEWGQVNGMTGTRGHLPCGVRLELMEQLLP